MQTFVNKMHYVYWLKRFIKVLINLFGNRVNLGAVWGNLQGV